MKVPFVVNLMYISMPIVHIILFYLGIRFIPRPKEDDVS